MGDGTPNGGGRGWLRMVAALAGGLVLAGACATHGPLDRPPAPAADPLAGEWIDLTHPFDETTVYWPTAPAFELRVEAAGHTAGGFYYSANSFCAAEHGGTHVDAPVHFSESGIPLDEIPLERLIGPAVVVDVTEKASADRDYRVGVADLAAWEREHGPIPEGAIVLLRTGFGRHWPDRERYMGTAARGPEAVAGLHFPGLDADAARWLAGERGIAAVGLDTPSIDPGPSTDFAAHVELASRGVPALENVANLDRLPPTGAHVLALPMKIRGGSGGPARIVALIPAAAAASAPVD